MVLAGRRTIYYTFDRLSWSCWLQGSRPVYPADTFFYEIFIPFIEHFASAAFCVCERLSLLYAFCPINRSALRIQALFEGAHDIFYTVSAPFYVASALFLRSFCAFSPAEGRPDYFRKEYSNECI